jgi:chromosome segregation ATPase
MHRTLLLLGALWLTPAALAQSPSTDSTLQALLNEVRLLRQQLEAHNAAGQRTQILFFRIQTQQAAVTRASQRVDDARGKLADTQEARRKLEGEAKAVQDNLEHADNPADRKNFENMISYFKRHSEELNEEEQQRQAKVSEAEEQLRAERAKLDDLDARLDELERELQHSLVRPN